MAQANKGSRHTSFGLWISANMLLFTVRSQTDGYNSPMIDSLR